MSVWKKRRLKTYDWKRPLNPLDVKFGTRPAPGVNDDRPPREYTKLGDELVQSKHFADVRVRKSHNATKHTCRKCGQRAIYYYAGWSLCKLHAQMLQTVITTLKRDGLGERPIDPQYPEIWCTGCGRAETNTGQTHCSHCGEEMEI